jgi:hypothetical protein
VNKDTNLKSSKKQQINFFFGRRDYKEELAIMQRGTDSSTNLHIHINKSSGK